MGYYNGTLNMLSWNILRRRSTLAIIINMVTAVCVVCYMLVLSNHENKHETSAVTPSHSDSKFDNNENSSNGWVHPRCNCTKYVTRAKSDITITSTCPFADFRGPHQKVLSYSFYGDTNSKYFIGVPINAEGIATRYPGWTMRLYHNINPTDISAMSSLCREVCRFPHLDECYVGDVTHQFENITNTFGMLWRFLVLGDPTVDIFGVRDIDSKILQREVDAVNEWLASNKTWHIMRDHPQHWITILGGMWGARNNVRNISQMRNILENIITKAKGHYWHLDQKLLEKMVWPVAKQDMVAHDSFLCQRFPDTRPWPSPRVNGSFVGGRDDAVVTNKCPLECRPKGHQDWTYC